MCVKLFVRVWRRRGRAMRTKMRYAGNTPSDLIISYSPPPHRAHAHIPLSIHPTTLPMPPTQCSATTPHSAPSPPLPSLPSPTLKLRSLSSARSEGSIIRLWLLVSSYCSGPSHFLTTLGVGAGVMEQVVRVVACRMHLRHGCHQQAQGVEGGRAGARVHGMEKSVHARVQDWINVVAGMTVVDSSA